MIVKRDPGLLKRLRIPSGLALFFAMVLPWFVAVAIANHDFLWEFFMVQQFLRFLTTAQHRPGPWWYFIPLLALAIVPWLVAAARGLVAPLRRLFVRGDFDADVLLWLWIVVIFVFFSASHSKLPSYILPVIPALAVLIGKALADRRALPWTAASLSLLLGAAVIALGVFAPRIASDADPALLAAFQPWVIAAGAVILAVTPLAVVFGRHGVFAVAAIAAAWLLATRLIMLGGAAFGPEYSTRALAAAVALYNRPGVPVYSVDGYQQTLPFYLRRTMILVRYRGEMDFGIEHAHRPVANRYLPTLDAFARRWRAEPEALAFVPRKKLDEIAALGIRFRIVAGNARWIAFVAERSG
jgi:4-amino-4-deoxy-L-arabinose transferase-like glycosyltransferase